MQIKMVKEDEEQTGVYEVFGNIREKRCLTAAFLMLTLSIMLTHQLQLFLKIKEMIRRNSTTQQEKREEGPSVTHRSSQVVMQYSMLKQSTTSKDFALIYLKNRKRVIQRLLVGYEQESKFVFSDQLFCV